LLDFNCKTPTFTWNNNAWYDVGGTYDWYWSGDLTTFAGWQAKGFDSAGVTGNPQLHGTVGSGPAAYQLASSSPLIDKGANVSSIVYGGMGTRDYFGTSIPQGCCYDIGAAEYSGTYSTMESPATPVAHTSFTPSIHVDAITMNTPTVSKGGTASWTITIKDANGVAVSGIPVTVWLLNQSWNAIDYTATATTNSSGVASFSTNATSSTGTYFLMLPYVDTSLTSYYYDSLPKQGLDDIFFGALEISSSTLRAELLFGPHFRHITLREDLYGPQANDDGIDRRQPRVLSRSLGEEWTGRNAARARGGQRRGCCPDSGTEQAWRCRDARRK